MVLKELVWNIGQCRTLRTRKLYAMSGVARWGRHRVDRTSHGMRKAIDRTNKLKIAEAYLLKDSEG